MIDSELKLYYDQIFAFSKSVVVKNSLLAAQAKDVAFKVLGVDITSDYQNPYYLKLCGEYSILDDPIYINEGGQKLLLNQALLKSKPWLRKKYSIYGSPFKKLCEENPGREVFLRYIINPPFNKYSTLQENLEGIIAAEDYSLLCYDSSILEVQEQYSLIDAVKHYVDMFKERWFIKEYGYEELYALDIEAKFYAFLPAFLAQKRIDNIKTQYAHTYHVWNHLRAYGLEDYRTVLTIDQQLFLYKNIEYIIQNIGKHGTLAILAEKILRQNFLSIEPKMLVLEYPDDYTRESIPVKPLIISRTFDDVPVSRYFDGDSLSIEQFLYSLYSNGFITKNDYLSSDSVEAKFGLLQQTTLQTKFLELKRELPHHPHMDLIFGMMVGGLIHFIYQNRIKYNVQVVVDKLDYNENIEPKMALLLMLYFLQKQQDITDPKIPNFVKAYPYVRNVETFSDEIIKTVEGLKHISDFIDINTFKTRYKSVDDLSDFNFNNEPVIVILKLGQLILEDLMLVSDGDLGVNQAINKLHNQMFQRVNNNQVALFDLGGTNISDWFKNHYYSLYELITKIELESTITYDELIEQIIEGFIPSALLEDESYGLRMEDDTKYEKLKGLFVQLCSYNVVFIDPNIKNQCLMHHSPVLGQITEFEALQGLTNIQIIAYEPIPYPSPFVAQGEEDPKYTGFFGISGQINDPFDELVEYTLELSRFIDFSTIDHSITGIGDMTKGFIGVKAHNIPAGRNYYARVRFRSDLLFWKLSEPSSGIAFNTGMIEPPVIHFPEITEYVDQERVKKPVLVAVTNKINGIIESSPFETEVIQVEGFSILLKASSMKLTFGHADLHIESRWFISKNETMTNLVYDSGWVTDLLEHRVPWDKNNTEDLYFAVKFKGFRYGESSLSNIGSFDMRALKKPVITNVDGAFDPLTVSILNIYGDPFTVVGDYPDIHDASKWTIAIDLAMTKVIYETGWIKTALEEIETPLIRNSWAESFSVKKPNIELLTNLLKGQYEFTSSPFDFIPLIGPDTPLNAYITVQYRGKYFGPSEVSDVFVYPSTLAPRGSIKIIIEPAEAITAGAKWRRKNTDVWRESAYVDEFLPVDIYTLEFNQLSGYYKPNDVLLTVIKDEVIEYTITFEKEVIKGNLQIFIEPSQAAAMGGWWRRKNTVKWNESGFIETGLIPGSYEIEIRELTEYSNRQPISVEILSGQTTVTTYSYELIGTPENIVEEISVGSDEILLGSKKLPPSTVTITIVGGEGIVHPGTTTIPYGTAMKYDFIGGYKPSLDNSKNTITTTASIESISPVSLQTGRIFEDCTISFNHAWLLPIEESIFSGSDDTNDTNNSKKIPPKLEDTIGIESSDLILSGSKRTPIRPYTVTSDNDQLTSSEVIISGSKRKILVGDQPNDSVIGTETILSGSKEKRLKYIDPLIHNDNDGSYIAAEEILYGFKRDCRKSLTIQPELENQIELEETILSGYKRKVIIVTEDTSSTDIILSGSKQIP